MLFWQGDDAPDGADGGKKDSKGEDYIKLKVVGQVCNFLITYRILAARTEMLFK